MGSIETGREEDTPVPEMQIKRSEKMKARQKRTLELGEISYQETRKYHSMQVVLNGTSVDLNLVTIHATGEPVRVFLAPLSRVFSEAIIKTLLSEVPPDRRKGKHSTVLAPPLADILKMQFEGRLQATKQKLMEIQAVCSKLASQLSKEDSDPVDIFQSSAALTVDEKLNEIYRVLRSIEELDITKGVKIAKAQEDILGDVQRIKEATDLIGKQLAPTACQAPDSLYVC